MKNSIQLIRFFFAGCLVIITDFVVYYIFINFFVYAAAKLIASLCGGTVAYIVNKYWTFEQKERVKGQIIKFIFANATVIGVNVASNEFFLALLSGNVFWAYAGATSVTGIYSFLIFKFWVF